MGVYLEIHKKNVFKIAVNFITYVFLLTSNYNLKIRKSFYCFYLNFKGLHLANEQEK